MSGEPSQPFVVEVIRVRWQFDFREVSEEEAARLRQLWERCRVPSAGPGDEGVEPFVVPSGDPYAVSRAVTLASLERRRGTAMLLHAAGVSDEDRAVALVGRSGAGKSTAVTVLGRRFGYLTDETVAIEDDGTVSPYPKPVSVITDPGAPWDKHELSPDEADLRKPSGPAYLSSVVVLAREATPSEPSLEPLPLVEALIAVTGQTSSLPMLDRPLERLAELLSLGGGPYVLRYRDIEDCVDLLADLLAGRVGGSEREPWFTTPGQARTDIEPAVSDPATGQAVDRAVDPAHGETGAGGDGPVDGEANVAAAGSLTDDVRIVRGPWCDALHGEGGSVVLIGDEVVHLGPIGEVVWGLAAQPVTVGEARTAVIAEFGAHPDGAAIVAEGITALLDNGVLRRT
ncbi:hypothetical protein [Knoellia remsis]|uniref:hypothetical protein n=1 Tax=Knoellia remsis TaxID=407159 RepID=UPI0011B26A15|nr:hypothetical protein [Knoellia remsis]